MEAGPSQIAMPRVTPVVRAILIACGALFVFQLLVERAGGFSLTEFLGFVPYRLLQGWVWQLITYSFLHAGVMHLLFNGLVIWTIGSELESLWGSRLFAIFFFTCVLGAALTYGLLAGLGVGSAAQPVVGSSGGVYGLLVAYGILFSERVLYFFMIFPMKARYFVLVLGGIELLSSLSTAGSGVAHVAHLGGMVTGFLFLATLAQWRRREKNALRNEADEAEERRRRLEKASHLRLVNEKDEKNGPKHWN